MKKIQLFSILFSTLFILASCGGGSGSGNNNNNGGTNNNGGGSSTSLPTDINGLIVLNLESWKGKGYSMGTYMIDFKNGKVKTHKLLTDSDNGISPYAYDRNNITYAEPCGEGPYPHTRTKIINIKRLSSAPIVPCSSKVIEGQGLYLVAKISPDKSKVVVEIDNGAVRYNYSPRKYVVKVFDKYTGEEIVSYENYDSPEWLPNGRLLVSASIDNDNKGIFIANKSFTNLTPIDGGGKSIRVFLFLMLALQEIS